MEEKDLTPAPVQEEAPKRTPLERAAGILSAVFTPFLIPTLSFVLMFYCTYMRILPLPYKSAVLGIVFSFTFVLPMLAIWLFQKVNGWGVRELGERKKRFIPYILAIMSYVTCFITMQRIHLPRYMSGIIVAVLICMVVCTLVNLKWKISAHTAGSGLMVGGLWSYSLIFNFNPLEGLCLFILLAGMVGSSRIILKQHSLSEVFAGFLVGFLCGIVGILFI